MYILVIIILKLDLNKTVGKISNLRMDFKLGSNGTFILISFIIVALVIDTSIVKISVFTGGLADISSNITIFTILALIFGLGQYLILGFVRRHEDINLHEPLRLNIIYKFISIIQYVLITILGLLILQMIFTSNYNLIFMEIIIWISYILSIFLLGLLSQRFLSWFKSNHNFVVLAYTLAMMMISINAIFTLVYVTNYFIITPVTIQPISSPVQSYGVVPDIFNEGYFTTSVLSFMFTWIATTLLLRSYARKLGKAKYWTFVSIPLLYFLSQFQSVFFDLFTPLRIAEPITFGVVYTLFFSATIPVGGILFGIAFWNVARNIRRDAVKRYMMISAYGMMLLFSSNQASGLVLATFPPFGLVSVSFFGLSSYLIFVGIYSSALSVANDTELRRSIKKSAQQEVAILKDIGTSQMENQIMKLTKELVGKSEAIIEETGISSSLEEEEIQEYLKQVVEEIKKDKQI